MDTQTQIDRLIELAIIQRTELKQLVEQLPQLREHLNSEVEKVFDEVEPQLRVELEEWAEKKASDSTAKLGNALEAKITQIAADLQVTTQARFDVLKEQERKLEQLRSEARNELSAQVAILPETVKEIVGAELARFPRAGEIDQLRKEFAEPRGLNPRGKWQAGETYNRLDLVTYNGDSFVSNIDGNTEKPSRNAANWTLNAARGAYGGGGGITSLNDVLNAPTSGQIIGSQNGQYIPKTLVAGANITINETASSITIIGDEGQISLQDGTAAAPSLFFTSDTDTGLYRPATNTLGVAVGGAQVAYFDANGITTVGAGATIDGSVHAANGNANNPSLSFTSDDNTGFFRHQPDEIGITLGGTQTGTLTSALATLTSKLLVSSGATTTAATDLLVNPAVKASGNLLDLQVASSSKFSVSSAGNGTFGGNLTVSGTGTVGNTVTITKLNGSGLITKAGAAGYSLLSAIAGATDEFQADFGISSGGSVGVAGTKTAHDFILRTNDTERVRIAQGTGAVTMTGNLTVSGGTSTFGTANGGTYITTPGTAASTGSLFIQGGNASGSTAGGGVVLYGGSHASAPGWVRVGLAGTSKFAVNTSGLGSGTDVFTVDQAGNLTVSGTGTSSVAGSLQANGGTAQSVNTPALRIGNDKILVWLDSSSTTTNAGFLWYDSSNILRIGAENGTRIQVSAATTTISNNLTVSGTGNSSVAGTLLVATTTNSSNGKLQLATHTTSAGGIGFGTDTSLYRVAAGNLTLSTSTAGAGFSVTNSTNGGQITAQSAGTPMFVLSDTTQALNEKIWGIRSSSASFIIGAWTDSYSAISNAIKIDRSSGTPSLVTVTPDATFAGSVKATTKVTIGNSAQSPSIYGSSSVTVGTTAVDLSSTSFNTGAIAVVSGYNNSGGQQGVWLIIATGGGLISTVASQNATGLTPTFSISAGKLQMSLASGSMSVVMTILGVTGL